MANDFLDDVPDKYGEYICCHTTQEINIGQFHPTEMMRRYHSQSQTHNI
jgi:hypothetical protein